MKLFSLCLAVIFSLTLFVSVQSASAEGAKVRVLFDFGDGAYSWADVVLGTNNTAFNATLAAAGSLGLNVTYQWSSIGVFVEDIGDRHAPDPAWWHLYTWNGRGASWEFSMRGAGSLNMTGEDAIAWFLAVDNPYTFETPLPSPTPLNPYPQLYYRHDLSNTGRYGGPVCSDHALAWQYDTGAFEISGTPAAANGSVFVPTWGGLFALSEETGALLWKRADISGMSSPAVYNDGLFIGARDGKLHHLSASDGREIWTRTLISPAVYTGIASSPKPYMDKVFVGLFNESGGKGGVVALDIWNGTVDWTYDSPSVHTSSPAVKGDSLYIGVMGYFNSTSVSFNPPYGLLALNASTGARLWFLPAGGSVASSPLILGSSVLFTSRDGILHAVSLNGTPQWFAALSPSTSSPATDGQTIFAADGVFGGQEAFGHVTALTRTGQVLWKKTLSGPVQTSPLYADGVLLVATNEERGTIYAMNATDGAVIWSYTPSPGDYMLSFPVVADGRTFAASDNGIVYAFGCTSPQSSQGSVDYAVLVVFPIIAAAAVAGVAYLFWRRTK